MNLPWLTIASFRKFTSPIDILAYIIPSSFFYFEFIPKIFKSCPFTLLVVTTVLVAVILFLNKLREKFKDYEKGIAEVLAIGYFSNFFERTANFFADKKQDNEDVTFTFRDKRSVKVKTDKIKVKVILPTSLSKLEEVVGEVDVAARIASIDNGAWVNAAENSDGSITVYECPRTLQAISRYLVNGKEGYNEEHSRRMHTVFNERFKQDWDLQQGKIPKSIFSIEYDFPNNPGGSS